MNELFAWDVEREVPAILRHSAVGAAWTVEEATAHQEKSPLLMSSGWIDIQVNGARGIAFNSADLTVDGVHQVTEYLRSAGIAQYCPTLITDCAQRLVHALEVIRRAAEEPPSSTAILAVHLEGPYISPQDGPRGAHPREWVRVPDREEFRRFQEAAGGLIGIVTLAPETAGGLDFIEWLREQEVVPAIGHTGATPEDVFAAAERGALLATHVGNAAGELQHRHRSNIYAQLADDRLMASFIADGHHLPPWVLKVFLRAKGSSRSILVSDLMHWAGMPPGRYRWEHLTVEITPEGAARVAGEPRLAGATEPLLTGVANTLTWTDLDLKAAVRLVTENPRRLLAHSRAARERLIPTHTLFGTTDGRVKPCGILVGGELVAHGEP